MPDVVCHDIFKVIVLVSLSEITDVLIMHSLKVQLHVALIKNICKAINF